MINITFPDGSVRAYESGVTGYEIAKGISPRLAEEVLAVAVKPVGDTTIGKGQTIDLNRPIEEDCSITLLKWEDDEAKRVFWHSSSHLMAEALEDLYPGVKFGIGPAIENGFYYDVDLGGNPRSRKECWSWPARSRTIPGSRCPRPRLSSISRKRETNTSASS